MGARPDYAVPLRREDVAQELWQYIDWHSQGRRGKYKRLQVSVQCPFCLAWRDVVVSYIRATGDRWTALCIKHRNKARYKPLTKAEAPSELWDYLDFEGQESRGIGKNAKLHIGITCPDCGEKRWVHVGSVRQQLADGWTARCQGCANVDNAAQRTGPNHYNWKGGRNITHGYIERHIDTWPKELHSILYPMTTEPSHKYIREHRGVVAVALGRSLSPSEQVHHINGDRADNRLENLRLVDHHGQPLCPHCGWPMSLDEYVSSNSELAIEDKADAPVSR